MVPSGQFFVFPNVEGFPFKKWLLLDTALEVHIGG
jgi:hypothetical protein